MTDNDGIMTEIVDEETGLELPGNPPVAPAMPQLPDGIGLSLDQVANLLAEKNKTIVSLDDPILMTVTMLNAFLAEEDRLMERHKGAITQVLASRTDKFVQAVGKAAASVSETFSGQAVTAMKEAVAEHSKAFAAMEESLISHQANIRWWGIIALVSAVVNVAVFVFLAVGK